MRFEDFCFAFFFVIGNQTLDQRWCVAFVLFAQATPHRSIEPVTPVGLIILECSFLARAAPFPSESRGGNVC